MSHSGRGQKCTCEHPRQKHNPNAGVCLAEECSCKFFKAVKVRGKRLKDSSPKKKDAAK